MASSSPRGSCDAECDFAVRSRLVAQKTTAMRIPHLQLSPTALRAVVEEFVTRDGTDHSSVDERIESVLHQLDVGSVELHFEPETETCTILLRGDTRKPHAGSEDA